MKLAPAWSVFLLALACSPPKQPGSESTLANNKTAPVNIIFDTDIAGDYDDVGAMALLHAFADAEEANILAMASSNAFHTTVPTMDVINTYFNRPDIPIGVTKRKEPNMLCQQQWAEALIAKYPHDLKSNNDAPDATILYRKTLAAQPDSSVTIITVGFFTNMVDLMDSPADEYSPLNGKELIAQKVKLVVSMAAGLPEGKDLGREYNVFIDTKASKRFFSEWTVPTILSPFEVGEKIKTGIRLILNDSINNSPVKEAYQIALTKDNNTEGRMSWDQTAVLVAVRGWESYFTARKANFSIEEDGTNVLIPGERFTYLGIKEKPEVMARLIEDLMMHQPLAH